VALARIILRCPSFLTTGVLSMSVTPPRPEEPAARPEGASDPAQLPALTDVPTLEAPQVYRPLSLLAVLALVLGVAFSLLVVVGGVMPFARAYPRAFVVLLLLGPILGGLGAILMRQKGAERIATVAALALGAVVVLVGLGGLLAFSGSSPWELGGWAWVLLFAAVLVSVLSLAQIRSSEGALAGRRLARWGLYLSLFFGGYYLIYLGGNQFAVSSQAEKVADGYLDMIEKGALHKAYRETLKPGSRPGDTNLAEEIEQGHNVPRGREAGEFAAFCTSPVVQAIRLGGKTERSRKSSSSELTPTGYVVKVHYDVRNDFGHFEVIVMAHSVEVGGRREWQVIGPASTIVKNELETPLATDVGRVVTETAPLVTRWLEAITAKQPEVAYLLTLPEAPRRQQGRALVASRPELAALAGSAPSMALQPLTKEYEELKRGTDEFKTGKTIIDASKFVSFIRDDPQVAKDQLKEAYDFLSNSTSVPSSAEMVPAAFPTTRRVGDEYEVERPARLLFHTKGQPGYFIDCDVICRGTPGGPAPAEDHYRVVKLRLKRSALVSDAKGPGGAPPPPPPPPPPPR
jgi:hypothetical protein